MSEVFPAENAEQGLADLKASVLREVIPVFSGVQFSKGF